MPSPFPGMDPYLENSEIWPEFHNRLLVAIADVLGPQLRPKYRVAIEKRVYQDAAETLQIGRPDVSVLRTSAERKRLTPPQTRAAVQPVMVELPMPEEVRERFLEIREVGTGKVIATLEIISPSNKRPGRGRKIYEEKRLKVLSSQTHLVEIDLIRSFGPLPLRSEAAETLYRIVVSQAEERPLAALYGFNLPDPIPPFPLPLGPENPAIWIDLQELANAVYDRASYDLAIDYSQDPVPPLNDAELAWAQDWLVARGLRD